MVHVHRDPCTWLRLPDAFAGEMVKHALLGLWRQPNGCCNGSSWVATDFSSLPPDFMFMRRGWKPFARARGLMEGHTLLFKYGGAATLFMKIFGTAGYRMGSCMESDSSGSSGGSSGSSSTSSGGEWNDDDSDDSNWPCVKEEDFD